MSKQISRILSSITTAAVVALTCSAADAAPPPNADADWTARSTAPGVFYKNNFDFGSTAELISSNWGHAVNWPDRAVLETTNILSGRGAFRALIPNSSDESTVAYQHSFDMPVGSQTLNTVKRRFYYQFEVYLPRYILDHRFSTLNDQSDVGHKFAIIQAPNRSFDVGEVVVTNWSFRWFVKTYYFSASGSVQTFDKAWSVKPSDCLGGPEYGWQNAIDAGPQSSGGQTDATSCALFKRRYGPMHYSMSGTNNYGGGTLTAQGNPDPNAAINGAVWTPDAWNVIEVYVEDAPGPNDTVKVWHAVRGSPPKLVTSSTGIDLGDQANNYTGVQLVPRLEQLVADSTRQDTYAIYSEIIASDNFIEFPGSTTAVVKPNPPTNLIAQP
jgi:hypothetical protein